MALGMLLLGSAHSQAMALAQLCPPSVRWVTFLPITAQIPWPANELGGTSVGIMMQQGKGTRGHLPQHFRAYQDAQGREQVVGIG